MIKKIIPDSRAVLTSSSTSSMLLSAILIHPKAIVSATCEMVIQVINGQVDRYFDEEIGLNLLKL